MREILELSCIPVLENTNRELWIRGQDSHWHRYAIFPDRIEALDGDIFGARSFRNLGQQSLPVG